MEKISLQTGMAVKSLKGHDTGRLYIVVKLLSEDFALISDGKYRKLENPKLKRIKHIKIMFMDGEPKILDFNCPTPDSKIVKFLKTFEGR